MAAPEACAAGAVLRFEDVAVPIRLLGTGSYGWVWEFNLRPGFEHVFGVPAEQLVAKQFRDVSLRPPGLDARGEEFSRYKLLTDPAMERMLEREVGVLTGIDHPNLVKFYRAFRRHDAAGRLVEVYVIQEKVIPPPVEVVAPRAHGWGPGELLFYLSQQGSIVGGMRRARAAGNEGLAQGLESKARLLAYQMLRGLHALHSHVNPATGRPAGIMHRDMKPENVLCGGRDRLLLEGTEVEVPRVKICDFGLARPQLDVAAGALHTPVPVSSGQYTAPELYQGRKDYTSKVDIWSAGTTLYVILTCAFPFNSSEEPSNIPAIFLPRMLRSEWRRDRIAALGPAAVEPAGAAADPPAPRSDVLDLLHALLHPSDAERPTAAQALSHPWFAPVAAVVADHAGPYRDPILVRLSAAREAKGGPLAAAEAEAAARGEAAPAAPAAAAAEGGGSAAPGAGEEVVDM